MDAYDEVLADLGFNETAVLQLHIQGLGSAEGLWLMMDEELDSLVRHVMCSNPQMINFSLSLMWRRSKPLLDTGSTSKIIWGTFMTITRLNAAKLLSLSTGSRKLARISHPRSRKLSRTVHGVLMDNLEGAAAHLPVAASWRGFDSFGLSLLQLRWTNWQHVGWSLPKWRCSILCYHYPAWRALWTR